MPPRHLRSREALLFQSLTIGFSVEAAGSITDAPSKFAAGPNEIVTWVVGNASGEPITVSLTKFLRKKKHNDQTGDPNDQVAPFRWLGSNTVRLDRGQTGIIAGRMDPNYTRRDFFDHLSYTIQVDGPFGTIEYDPDGDIKP
jgi:hypothetical protein